MIVDGDAESFFCLILADDKLVEFFANLLGLGNLKSGGLASGVVG